MKLVALIEPKFTAVAPVKPVPVIVTCVPPAKGPAEGLTVTHRGRADDGRRGLGGGGRRLDGAHVVGGHAVEGVGVADLTACKVADVAVVSVSQSGTRRRSSET